LLSTDGDVRRLIGPREAPRLRERHLLHCAVVSELMGPGARVIDVGSGAGWPGLVRAVARPELSVGLVEPLARRSAFLTEVVSALDLSNASVLRARAEELTAGRGGVGLEPADVVTARAVAPLNRLVEWCLPLAIAGGRLLALKGDSAAEEVQAHRAALMKAGGGEPIIRRCGEGLIDPPTIIVEIAHTGRAAAARPIATRPAAARSIAGKRTPRRR
jgi:16S rRNA (guanine527-N7)-methyltransferase